jgi:hypothetical protein
MSLKMSTKKQNGRRNARRQIGFNHDERTRNTSDHWRRNLVAVIDKICRVTVIVHVNNIR